jgi:5-methylcytosine-specific restriction protein A
MPTIERKSIPAKWQAERPPQQRRNVDNSAFYNSRQWRSTSKAFIFQNPTCAECERNDLIEPATCTDHIKPIEEGGSKWSWSNLQALCNHCHAVKSGREAHSRKG